jgi:hypothetical protein
MCALLDVKQSSENQDLTEANAEDDHQMYNAPGINHT